MFAWAKQYIWGGIVAIIAVLALVVGIQTQRNKALKAEANGAKKEAEKATEQLETVNAAVKQAENKRQEVLKTEVTLENIKSETAAAVEEAKKLKAEKKTVHLGRSLLVIALMFVLSGCGYTLADCRAKYSCPENVCIKTTPPSLSKLQRPALYSIDVDWSDTAGAYLLTEEQMDAVSRNEQMTAELIKGYERIIDVYNDWRLRQ